MVLCTQTPPRLATVAQKAKSGFQISYVTITYRSVALGALCLLLLAGIVLYFVFPDRANKMVQSGEGLLQTLLVKVGLASSPNPAESSAIRRSVSSVWSSCEPSVFISYTGIDPSSFLTASRRAL